MKKEEYTYADVIIDPNDERVKIGEKYYMGDSPNLVLERANEAKDFAINTLVKIDNVKCWYPFKGENQRVYCCLIKAKESQDEYVPFDLSKKEVRDKLRGQWIVPKNKNGIIAESMIDRFAKDSFCDWLCIGYPAEELLEKMTFLDGTPCGEKVEE